MARRWLLATDACEILGISKSTLYRRIKQGKIESRQEGERKTFCLIDVPNETKQVSDGTTGSMELLKQIRDENEYLRQELDARKQEVAALQKKLSERSQRQDTIILQLTRQLEQSQRLLEYHQDPWYRRWFRRKRGMEENRS